MSKQQLQQAKLLDLVEQALTQPPAKRESWLERNSEPESLDAARRLLDLAASATSGVWEGPAEGANQKSLIGRQIGPYSVAELIGEGGMGQVYLAHRNDSQFEQSVAIKVVRVFGASNAITQQFEIERQILANLRHANIAALLDGGMTEDGLHYVVMEYVDGQSLNDYLALATPTLNDTLRLFVKVCRAVQSAHQALIIHRDIKPGNILVGQDGEPKLLDFGIAKVLPASGQSDDPQTILGALTPAYASPEQIRGEPLTTASDVYALGVVLYEALTGERPHDTRGMSPAQTERALTEQRATPPSERRVKGVIRYPTLGRDLDAIVLKALAAETSRRYGAAGALADDIERFLRQEPVTAQRDSNWYRLRKLVSRNRVGAAATGLTVFSVLVGLVVALWQAGVAREQRALAVMQLERAEAVSDFLGEILLSPSANWDSSLQTGTKATISDVLDAAEQKMPEALEALPDVRIELLTKISEARLWMNQTDRAEALMRDAVATADRELPAAAPMRVEARYQLGNALLESWEYAAAIAAFEDALMIGEANGSMDDLQWMYIVDGKALAHSQLGEFERALNLQTQAAERWLQVFGEDPMPAWAEGFANKAYYEFLTGDLDAALSSLRRAEIAVEKFPTLTTPVRAEVVGRKAKIRYLQRRDAEALEGLRIATEYARVQYEEYNEKEDYTHAASFLAMRLCDAGAVSQATEMLNQIQNTLGDFLNYSDGWVYQEARAWCAVAVGQYDAALRHSAESHRLGKAEVMAPGVMAQRAHTLALAHAGLGQTAAAREAANRSVSTYGTWLGDEHPMTLFVERELALAISSGAQ